jgi:hypothetical protein
MPRHRNTTTSQNDDGTARRHYRTTPSKLHEIILPRQRDVTPSNHDDVKALQ